MENWNDPVYVELFYKRNRPHFVGVYRHDNVIYKLIECSPKILRGLSLR